MTTELSPLRLGRFTASEIHRLMGEPRKKTEKLSDVAKTYVLEKIAETITGMQKPAFSSAATEWGEMYEGAARELFTMVTGHKIEPCDFIEYKEYAGGTPDGMGDGIGIEIKCPYDTTNHIRHMTIRDQGDLKEIAKDYYYQCMSLLKFTGADVWYFVSFDPRCNAENQIHIVPVYPDNNEFEAIQSKIDLALEHMKSVVETINTRNHVEE